MTDATRLAELEAENTALRARAVVAEQHKLLDRLGRSSYQEVVEDQLRERLALAELRAEAAEAKVDALLTAPSSQQDEEEKHEENESRVGPLKAGDDVQDLPRRGQPAEVAADENVRRVCCDCRRLFIPANRCPECAGSYRDARAEGYKSDAAALRARLHALTGYVQHKPGCGVHRCALCGFPAWRHDVTEDFDEVTCIQTGGAWTASMGCTCGLADLLTPASAEEPEKRT